MLEEKEGPVEEVRVGDARDAAAIEVVDDTAAPSLPLPPQRESASQHYNRRFYSYSLS